MGENAAVSTLVLFCRRPLEGVGKQRIAATAGTAVARELGERLLASALEDAASWPGPVALSPADGADLDWAGTLLTRPAEVVAQGDGNLGERLHRVDQSLRAQGHEQLLYIGSDAPLLDFVYYARARLALRHADIVLGPAEDGGVTLMGGRVPWPQLADLPWETAALGDALDRRCRSRGLTVHRLETSYDVDEVEILPRLYRDLARDPRPARLALRAWLETSAAELIVGKAPDASPAW